MSKYIRGKADGFVYDFNPHLATKPGMDVFESDESPMPERIADLAEYLAARNEVAAPSRRRGRPPLEEAAP